MDEWWMNIMKLKWWGCHSTRSHDFGLWTHLKEEISFKFNLTQHYYYSLNPMQHETWPTISLSFFLSCTATASSPPQSPPPSSKHPPLLLHWCYHWLLMLSNNMYFLCFTLITFIYKFSMQWWWEIDQTRGVYTRGAQDTSSPQDM